MHVSFAPSFLKQLDKLDPQVRTAAKAAATRVIEFYEASSRTPGLGVKRLRGDIWEARAGLRIRVLYRLSNGELRFVLAGSHDDVKRFLSEV